MSCWWYINLVIKSCYLDTMGRIRITCDVLEKGKYRRGEGDCSVFFKKLLSWQDFILFF